MSVNQAMMMYHSHAELKYYKLVVEKRQVKLLLFEIGENRDIVYEEKFQKGNKRVAAHTSGNT